MVWNRIRRARACLCAEPQPIAMPIRNRDSPISISTPAWMKNGWFVHPSPTQNHERVGIIPTGLLSIRGWFFDLPFWRAGFELPARHRDKLWPYVLFRRTIVTIDGTPMGRRGVFYTRPRIEYKPCQVDIHRSIHRCIGAGRNKSGPYVLFHRNTATIDGTPMRRRGGFVMGVAYA
jgi:hypothetical protein